jgi:hypothetical protein
MNRRQLLTARARVGVAAVLVLGVACLVGVGTATGATERTGALITPCEAQPTRAALGDFVRAFNAGDYRRLNALFAGPSWFRWYSSNAPGQRLRADAQNRATLIRYFRSRHRKADRLRLVSFRFNGNSNGYGNFIWKMRRSAADFRSGAWFKIESKGTALCRDENVSFIVMSLGAPEA